MTLVVAGLATSHPSRPISQSEAAELAEHICCRTAAEAAVVRTLYRRAGVRNRYTVLQYQTAVAWKEEELRRHEAALELRMTARQADAGGTVLLQATDVPLYGASTRQRMAIYEEHAPPMAIAAAGEALAQSGLRADEITHLVTVSCTGFAAPGVDWALVGGLPLPSTVQRVNVGFMGCHGAINGLRVAQAFLGAQPDARVLLCAVEICSLHYCLAWDPARIVGNAIFSDGAAALVCHGRDDAPPAQWRLRSTGSSLFADSEQAMRWTIGDHGFQMDLSPRIPDLIAARLRPWLDHWLSRQGLCLADVGSWAVHPGGPRVLSAVERALDLPPSATTVSREVLADFGNMSSPTILFILQRLAQQSAARPCVALAFGPGLAAEAALFT